MACPSDAMVNETRLYCFAFVGPARTQAAGRISLYSNINICYTLPGLVFFYLLVCQAAIEYSQLIKFLTHPSCRGGGTLFIVSRISSKKKKKMGEKTKKKTQPSINLPFEPSLPWRLHEWERKRIVASSGQRKKQNVSAGRKRGALIERESTSCPG